MLDQNTIKELIGNYINNLIKVGVVVSINPQKHTAKVCFEEEDNKVSFDAPILTNCSFANKQYHMPDLYEDVLCLCSPNMEDIYILGSFYAGDVKPPCSNPDITMIKFGDESEFSYNRNSHVYTIKIGATTIQANGNEISLTTSDKVNISCNQATIQASKMSVNSPISTFSGDVAIGGNLTAGSGAYNLDNLEQELTELKKAKSSGAAMFYGSVNSMQDVIAGGISLRNHVHKEQGDGANTSAPK